jgi:hypothetical protein
MVSTSLGAALARMPSLCSSIQGCALATVPVTALPSAWRLSDPTPLDMTMVVANRAD